MIIKKIFDSHLHIIDPHFPLVANAGYLPESFTVGDYLKRTDSFGIRGGAVVSGSFQAYDQGYLVDALSGLGSGFVGVTQLPPGTSAGEIGRLHELGVRALRFNLRRGMRLDLDEMIRLALLAFEVAGWHAELYVDSRELPDLAKLTNALPRLCIDHLGLSRAGFPNVMRLVERGAWVKATGFGRLDRAPTEAMLAISGINPDALLFGTDLPGTRAPTPCTGSDLELLCEALADESLVRKVLFDNAIALYRPAREPLS